MILREVSLPKQGLERLREKLKSIKVKIWNPKENGEEIQGQFQDVTRESSTVGSKNELEERTQEDHLMDVSCFDSD